MELRLEIGSNMRKVLEEAGGLNEKWEDVVDKLGKFMEDAEVAELEIELRESDGEGGKRLGSVALRKKFAPREEPRVVNVLAAKAVQAPAPADAQEKPDEQLVFTDAADKAAEG